MSHRRIGGISNMYGGLHISTKDDKYRWGIDCIVSNEYEFIPKYLFDALNRFQDEEEVL